MAAAAVTVKYEGATTEQAGGGQRGMDERTSRWSRVSEVCQNRGDGCDEVGVATKENERRTTANGYKKAGTSSLSKKFTSPRTQTHITDSLQDFEN